MYLKYICDLAQGPLITDGRNSCKWTGPTVGLSKFFIRVKNIVKNGHVHEGGKVGRSNATPTNFFSVDSYDLKFMSFKFGNDIFITF
jgi:hypothetical protein